jgi:hypothetical protein
VAGVFPEKSHYRSRFSVINDGWWLVGSGKMFDGGVVLVDLCR